LSSYVPVGTQHCQWDYRARRPIAAGSAAAACTVIMLTATSRKTWSSLACAPPRRDPHEYRQPLKPAHRAMSARHRQRGGKILSKELLGKDDGRLSLADWQEIANSKLAAPLDEAATDGRPA
jgi:hypothetical protein